MIFLDTSAIYALADIDDKNHKKAKAVLENLLKSEESLLIHNYIIVESVALIQKRLGFSQACQFMQSVSNLKVIWVNDTLHKTSEKLFERKGKRKLSLVDCVSFIVMQQESVRRAFAFDDDFKKEGFEVVLEI